MKFTPITMKYTPTSLPGHRTKPPGILKIERLVPAKVMRRRMSHPCSIPIEKRENRSWQKYRGQLTILRTSHQKLPHHLLLPLYLRLLKIATPFWSSLVTRTTSIPILLRLETIPPSVEVRLYALKAARRQWEAQAGALERSPGSILSLDPASNTCPTDHVLQKSAIRAIVVVEILP